VKKLLFCLTLLVLAAAVLPPAPARAAEPRSVEVRVSKDDTLIALCQKYLQQPEKWQAVARLNRLAQPNLLTPGQKLVIPVQMLKAVPLEARVSFLKGTGFRKDSGAAGWVPLHQGDTVRVGNWLKSGPESSIEVCFADGTLFLLRENTTLSVKTAQQGLLHLLRVLYLEAGKIVTRVKAATGRDSRFEIETPSALAAARGTEYRVGVDQQATTRAELLESSIDFSSMGSSVALHQDEGSVAKYQEPPTPPRKLLPPPQPVDLRPSYAAARLSLRFAPVQGAAAYRVVLARDPEGKDSVKEATIAPADSFEAAPEDGSYYLIASSIDALGLEGRLSQPRQLVLHRVAQKTAVPDIAEPRDTARLQTTGAAIAWQKVAGAAGYRLQIARDPGFAQPLRDESALEAPAYATGALSAGSYYLRLCARAAEGGWTAWSPVTSFTILQPPPPSLHKTGEGGKGWDFAWDRPEPGISCQVQLAGDPKFEGIILDQTQAEPELHLDRKLAPGTYYLRVRGVDSHQQAGSYSEAASFTVEKPTRFPYELLGAGAVLLLLLL
jgi:hypothetical protein